MITNFKIFENELTDSGVLWSMSIYHTFDDYDFITIDKDNNNYYNYNNLLRLLRKDINTINKEENISFKNCHFILMCLKENAFKINYMSYDISEFEFNFDFDIRTSYENFSKLLSFLPKELNQDVIDDFCDKYISIHNNIENLKYNDVKYLFSNKIRQKYKHLIDAKNFDLI